MKLRRGWGLITGLAVASLVIGFVRGEASLPTKAHDAEPQESVRMRTSAEDSDWPQLGHDQQRTNYSPVQVDPPYCYAWKWYEAPIASRAQPVVADGRLFIGSMNGVLYARDAASGAPLWHFTTHGPIRHSAGVLGSIVVVSSYDGYTYGLDASTGRLLWRKLTGPSATAPLMDIGRGRAVVASTNGRLSSLQLPGGSIVWEVDTGAPILTSPSLSADGELVFLGNEDIRALAVRAEDGTEVWSTRLQGMSLADRYPTVAGSTIFFRSQPVYSFHLLLHEGDRIMDSAGPVEQDWATDWSAVAAKISEYLRANPTKSTFFALGASDGASLGIVPVLYTYGNNDIPSVPVVKGDTVYLTYRARHGIQTDGGSVHVSTKYDAELGQMKLDTLDITGLRQANYPSYKAEFRMTSDEPAMLTMGGDILWVDNWERLGGLNVATGELVAAGIVSESWPECGVECGPGGVNPFFPMSGSGPAYPFPSPRVTEGHQRGGLVIADDMLYWRVIEGGLAAIEHKSAGACARPRVYSSSPDTPIEEFVDPAASVQVRSLADYITLDLTGPVQNPPRELVQRLRDEVRAITSSAGHLMPLYLERGFSEPGTWPYNTSKPPGPPEVTYVASGNAYWIDPGELLYTMAMAYPYLDVDLQSDVRNYMASEMARYPPLRDLPWGDNPWLKEGVARERYQVPFRSELNSWPPPASNLSAIYALWLWSKNTGDWSYARGHWPDVASLFESRKDNLRFYADVSGAIGYARLAKTLGEDSAYQEGVQVALTGLEAGLDFAGFSDFAADTYLGPRGKNTGWSAPVFFGLTPELGLYLREQTAGAANTYLLSLENGDGLRWWYLTRAGDHAETGETSYLAPTAAWSHFLAHAYILGDSQSTLMSWLDWSWGKGDLYSIQKTVTAIQAADRGCASSR